MTKKAQRIFELSQNTLSELSNYDTWTAFLRSAAWQYKYPFSDQLLIYAQRPDATACASMSVWNNDVRRWVNRGATGIALLRENNGRYRLDYVFDVSDTNSFYGNELHLWQYDNRYDTAIIKSLEKSFGELLGKDNVTDAVVWAAHNAVLSNQEYLDELFMERDGSLLEELDQDNIEARFQRIVEMSSAYVILQRLGYNADEILDRQEFEHINDFNTPETISILGTAVSTISEEALRDISETIRREQVKFAQSQRTVYNETSLNERSAEYGNDIHPERRISDSELDSSAGDISDREVRDAAEDIPEEKPQEQIQHNADERNASETSGGNRQDSDRTDRTGSKADGGQRGRERADESERSARMDRSDEQLSEVGRGTDTEGTDLQLSFDDIFFSESEQQNNIRETEQRSVFSIPFISQQIID